MKKKIIYFLYLFVFVFGVLEISIRLLTKENKAHVELFLGKKHRYLLPLPSSIEKCHNESIILRTKNKYRVFHDTLGWSHGSWGEDTTEYPLFSNDKGMRITEAEYKEKEMAKTHYNIIAIGNSFTHSDFVKAEQSWPHLIQEDSGKKVANMGVGGYGLQQALLRLMTSNISADTVLFGAIWGDFERALEPVYTFYQGGSKTRPILDINQGAFQLINVPVLKPSEFCNLKEEHQHPIFDHIPAFEENVYSKAWWTYSYVLRFWVSLNHQKRYYNEKPVYLRDDGSLDYCIDLFALFHKYCRQNGIYGKVVLLDTGQNFRHKEKWKLSNPWDLVKGKLEEKEIPNIEFHKELYEVYSKDQDNLIHPIEKLHYSPQGNKYVFQLLKQNLDL